MLGVAEFVNENVGDEVGGQKEEPIVEANGFLGGTTAPDGFLAAKGDFGVGQAGGLAQLPEPGGELELSLATKPGVEDGLKLGGAIGAGDSLKDEMGIGSGEPGGRGWDGIN